LQQLDVLPEDGIIYFIEARKNRRDHVFQFTTAGSWSVMELCRNPFLNR
jgi:hypothetical protein